MLQDLLSAVLDNLGGAARLGLDVLSMLVLVGILYRRRAAAPEMTLVFTALNIGLFAAVSAIGSGHFPTGIGFGLFGLLSLVRALTDTAAVTAAVGERLGFEPIGLTVDEVDIVRDTTRVRVRVAVDD